MKLLLIGDIIGRPGRRAVSRLLPVLKHEYGLDLIIANAENAAGGLGLTTKTADELLGYGINVLTSGNHVWNRREIIQYLESDLPILRPLNYPPGVPGRGYLVIGQVLVVNLIGRTFMNSYDCPFRAMDKLLSELKPCPRIIVVDFHAEATSEKRAMGYYLDGRASVVVGTHTHVGTIDACLLPEKTAFVSDIGMVGPSNSIIGDDIGAVIHRFLTQLPYRLAVGQGSVVLNSVFVEVDDATGKAMRIERVDRKAD